MLQIVYIISIYNRIHYCDNKFKFNKSIHLKKKGLTFYSDVDLQEINMHAINKKKVIILIDMIT